MAYRFYKITLKQDGSENAQVDTYDNVSIAEGNFEFQKGLAMENGTFAFLMLLDNRGEIHNNYIAMVGEGTIKPRLFEVKVTETEETAKSYPKDDANAISAEYYKRLGGAKQDTKVKAEMLRGIGANGEQLEYSYWIRPYEYIPPEPTPEEPQE